MGLDNIVLPDERRNEIAWDMFRYMMGRREIKLSSLKRDLGNASKDLEIDIDELRAFVREMLLSYVE